MKNEGFSYNSCEKCGSHGNAENYHIEVASEFFGTGKTLKLCSSCAEKLKKDVNEFVSGWMKRDK